MVSTTGKLQPIETRRSISQTVRPRSLWVQVSLLVFQPVTFFRGLLPIHANRQWLWMAALLLLLSGFYAVRSLETTADPGGMIQQPSADFGVAPPGMGGFPPEGGPGFEPQPSVGTSGSSVSGNWGRALVASSGLLGQWLLLALLLCEVSMFNGSRPQFGRNFQIAIWASVPLAFMILLQIIYTGAGGQIGAAGLSGLLKDAAWFQELSPTFQRAARTLASQITVFWLWSLVLIYIGARQALRGKRWAVLLTLLVWVLVLVILPVVFGPADTTVTEESVFEMPPDGSFSEEFEMPLDESGIRPEEPPLRGEESEMMTESVE